jgi:hypothetical protein
MSHQVLKEKSYVNSKNNSLNMDPITYLRYIIDGVIVYNGQEKIYAVLEWLMLTNLKI